MASDVELAARAGHLPHPHVPGHDGAVTALPASLARARLDVGVDVLEVLEHVRLPRQEGLGLDAASEVLLERRVHGELEHRVDVHNDHLAPCEGVCSEREAQAQALAQAQAPADADACA